MMQRWDKRRRIQVAIAVAVTLLLVGLSLAYEMPVAILPLLIFGTWLPLMQRREGGITRRKATLIMLVAGLVAFVAAFLLTSLWQG